MSSLRSAIAVAPPTLADRETQMQKGTDFDEFVAARSGRLLRTAYLLTQDSGLAEDLLQTALAKAWFVWSRIGGDQEPYVRRILVNNYASLWRRKWNGGLPTEDLPDPGHSGHAESAASGHDRMVALGRLPKRQRVVIVLRYFEDLTEVETARVLECSVGTVKNQTAKALAKLRVDDALSIEGDPMRTDDLRALLQEHSDDVADGGASDRIAGVHQRIAAIKRSRSRGTAVGAAAVILTAAAGFAALPDDRTGDRQEPVQPPKDLPSQVLGQTVVRDPLGGGAYEYVDAAESDHGGHSVEIALPSGGEGWYLRPEVDSVANVVLVRVEGVLVRRLDLNMPSDVYVVAGESRTVTLTLVGGEEQDRIAVVVYRQTRPTMSEPPAEYAGSSLIDGVVGDPGQTIVEFELTVPEGGFTVASECWPAGLAGMVGFSVAGQSIIEHSCQDAALTGVGDEVLDTFRFHPRDFDHLGIGPGDTVILRAELTEHRPRRTSPSAEDLTIRWEATDSQMLLAAYEGLVPGGSELSR